jgi:hypothetical protein
MLNFAVGFFSSGTIAKGLAAPGLGTGFGRSSVHSIYRLEAPFLVRQRIISASLDHAIRQGNRSLPADWRSRSSA